MSELSFIREDATRLDFVEKARVQPRGFDLVWLLPDEELTRTLEDGKQPPPWPLRSNVRNGNQYSHLSRVEWKEIDGGQRIYVKGTNILMPGLPATHKFSGSGRVKLTGEDTDKIWWEVFNANAPSSMTETTRRNRFANLKRDGVCFTDYTGGHAYNPVLTTNNAMYLLGEDDFGGQLHYAVRLLKAGSLAFMQKQLADWELLKMKATNSTRAHEGRGVDPFWHLDGRDVFFLPFGLNTEIGLIQASRARKMSRTEPIPNSYFPPR